MLRICRVTGIPLKRGEGRLFANCDTLRRN